MRKFALLSGLLVFAAAAFAADPGLMNLVMPDAKILGGLNVTSARNSPFGQFIISKIAANDQHLQDFIAATGFDPRQDAAEVLVATAADPSKPGGLLLVRGNFDVARITSTASNHSNQQVGSYDGATLITGTERRSGATHALAFIGNSIAVAGQLADVKAALDRNQGANSIDPALAAQLNSLSATEDEWIVGSAPVSSLLPPAKAANGKPADQALQVLKTIQSFSAGVKFGSTVNATAQATASDANNAAALGSVVRLLVALASMNSTANPQLTPAVQLLQSLQVTINGQTVNLALTAPEDQIEAILNNVPHHQRDRRVVPRPARLRDN